MSMKFKIILFFLFAFIFVSLLSWFLQIYLFPKYFASYYFRDGMLKNGDWIIYNELALLQLSLMIEEGFSAWNLYPPAYEGISFHPISSITSLYYYLTNSNTPYFIVPLHALLYSTTLLYLFLTIKSVFKENISIIPLLIFLSLPSTAIYFTHINKEIYFWFSISVIFYNSLLFFNYEFSKINNIKLFILNVLVLIAALFFIFVLRSQFLQAFILFYILALLINIVHRLIVYKLFFKFQHIVSILLSFFFLFFYNSPIQKSISANVKNSYTIIKSDLYFGDDATNGEKIKTIENKLNIEISDARSFTAIANWNTSTIIPEFVDKIFFTIYKFRENFKLREKISIDHERQLNSTKQIIIYYPEAFLKGFFLPFMNNWFNSNEIVGDKAQFLFAYEMFITYSGLILFFFFFITRFNYQLLYLFIFSALFISIIIYLYPNIGTLFRYRFYFINLCVITGWTYLLTNFMNFNKTKKDQIS